MPRPSRIPTTKPRRARSERDKSLWTAQSGLDITRAPKRAQIAQLVEQRIENPRVAGSIPALGTTTIQKSVLTEGSGLPECFQHRGSELRLRDKSLGSVQEVARFHLAFMAAFFWSRRSFSSQDGDALLGKRQLQELVTYPRNNVIWLERAASGRYGHALCLLPTATFLKPWSGPIARSISGPAFDF
jgi:hypothetical protein